MSQKETNPSSPIRNKVQESSLVVLDLENYKPKYPVIDFDIASLLEKGLIARRDSFQANLKKVEWENYTDRHVAVHCSTSAILPPWPFLKIIDKLQPVARSAGYGDKKAYRLELWKSNIDDWDQNQFIGERIILKANKTVPHAIFLKAGYRLREVVQTLMYGMPANAVPIFKRKISK